MKPYILTILVFLCCLACNSTDEQELPFDKAKWKTKNDRDYPYRDQMLNEIVYNDTVRTLNKNEILELLGEPDRMNDGHLYYMIAQKRLGFWPLHTKTLVIKLSNDSTINWIKIHE